MSSPAVEHPNDDLNGSPPLKLIGDHRRENS
jgi:hypothetical protein